MSNGDAIAGLLRELDASARPSPGWIAQWSRDGRDPVACAWCASRDSVAMIRFALRFVGVQAFKRVEGAPAIVDGPYSQDEVDAVAQRVPTIETFDGVLIVDGCAVAFDGPALERYRAYGTGRRMACAALHHAITVPPTLQMVLAALNIDIVAAGERAPRRR